MISIYITCVLSDEQKHSEMNKLVRKVQIHHHTTTYRKKGVTCRFNAPGTPSLETKIVCCEKSIDEMKVKSTKKVIEKLPPYTAKIDDHSHFRNNMELQRNNITVQKTMWNKRFQYSI